jgi:RNA polymerase sigma-70 factor (ECF subfamily)
VSRRAVGGDEALVRRLFEEHGAALVAYAARLTGDRARGDDLVREVLLRAWRDPEIGTGERGAVRAHLMSVARTLAGPRPAETDSPALLRAVEVLPADQRAVLRALYFEGRDVAEAAAALGVSDDAVKKLSHHALRRLREAVARPAAIPEGATG